MSADPGENKLQSGSCTDQHVQGRFTDGIPVDDKYIVKDTEVNSYLRRVLVAEIETKTTQARGEIDDDLPLALLEERKKNFG
jgi:hypothetical protein